MELNKLKENIKLLQNKIQNYQFSKINLDLVTYEEMVLLLQKYYSNEEICSKIIFSDNFNKLLEEEKNTTRCSLQLDEILNKIISTNEEINESDVYKIYEILNKPIEGLDVLSLRIFIDEIIELCLKNNDIEGISSLIYDLISRYFSLDLLSKKMIKFYVIDAIKEDNLGDYVKKVNFKKLSGSIAVYCFASKTLDFDYNAFDDYFKRHNITLTTTKNRILLQIIEHELDHSFMHKIRSSYNVLALDYKEQMKIKEFKYYINSLRYEIKIKTGFDKSLFPFIENMYSEHRANTFGLLKSMKRIKRKYRRFLPSDVNKKLFSETFLNIANLYSYKVKVPYDIQDEVYYKLYRKQFKDDSSKEFISESFEKTKELFEELFDEEFSEEVLSELHRIMVGEQSINNYELKEFVEAMDGDKFIETISSKR